MKRYKNRVIKDKKFKIVYMGYKAYENIIDPLAGIADINFVKFYGLDGE